MDWDEEEPFRNAERMAEDFDEAAAEDFAEKHRRKPWHEQFVRLFRLAKDKRGGIPLSTWLIVAGAIAYAVSPVDAIPDVLLGIGFIDDVAVLTVALGVVEQDLNR